MSNHADIREICAAQIRYALIMAQDNSSGVNTVGYYDDEFVRVDAQWRLAKRRFTTVLVRTVGGS